ncbi:MAG: glycosyltransferase [Thermoflexales bacterium]|nr:glycosyltransferase [Thermoflexales bacterium]
MAPLVSVVIPSYNHARFIGEAVKSVLSQTLRDLEVIVIDDGSKDETLRVLAGIKDERLKVFTQENRGAHEALNRGIALSQGQFISILNSDDAYTTERLERLVSASACEPGSSILGSFIQVIDEHGQPLGIKRAYRSLEPWALAHPELSFRSKDDLRAALLTENFFATTSNFFASRDVFEAIGPFRPLRYTHDWDFLLRGAQNYPLKVVEEPLLKYRVHGSNTIRENQHAMIFEILWCLAVHLPKHLSDERWLSQEKKVEYFSSLVHSIYAFGCERLLVTMLAQGIAWQPEEALSLLQPRNELRQAFLSFIKQQTSEHESQAHAMASAHTANVVREFLRKVSAKIIYGR